ncbi:MAG: hypothetical protein DRN04_15415 [Thermoprotei archaeon]|nr:MAG: hypothetical protein DRN04_15415 [Thermoprotei archaeon]
MKFIEYVKLLSRELREVIYNKKRKWFELDLNRKMPEYRKARKIYFADPFIMQALNAWVYGYLEVFEESIWNLKKKYKPFVMECVVVSHFTRLALITLRSPLHLVENAVFIGDRIVER